MLGIAANISKKENEWVKLNIFIKSNNTHELGIDNAKWIWSKFKKLQQRRYMWEKISMKLPY